MGSVMNEARNPRWIMIGTSGVTSCENIELNVRCKVKGFIAQFTQTVGTDD
jgi:hypothetical protein